MKFEKITFFVLTLLFASHVLLVNCAEVRNKLSLARFELAGLEKLGIVDLFSNFLRGVKKTFLPPQPGNHLKHGVNFINVFPTAFTPVDPNRVKKIQLSHQYLFILLGFCSCKSCS